MTPTASAATPAREQPRTCVSTCRRCHWQSGQQAEGGPILALLDHYRQRHGGIPPLEVR